MKRTFLTLTLAAHLAAGAAFAQTSGTTTETTDSGVASGAYGSDWSPTLGAAIFAEDGTTVRSESELVSQWETLSEDDKEKIRRDCTLHMQHSGGVSGSTGTQSGTSDTATDSTSDTSDSTGATTGSTGTVTGSAGTQSGSDTTPDTSADGSNAMMSVSTEQMEQICAATKDL